MKYSNLYFNWKHEDEKILYFCKPSSVRLKIELAKLLLPFFVIITIFSLLYFYNIINNWILIWVIAVSLFFFLFSFFYKRYRYNNNYLYITSKRILFHGLEWFFKDYVKKINYENIRNINYFTESFIWRVFKYGTLEIQSSHWWVWDITVYHINHWEMLTHYIDKLISLSKEQRVDFGEFDPDYFKDFKKNETNS